MAFKGYNGAVNGVSNIIKWELEQRASPNPGGNSATKNQANELEGVVDWTGYYIAHGHTPGTNPGGALTFKGSIDMDVDTNMTVEGTGMVERWSVFWDYANNRPITHKVDFGANGTAITYGDTAIDDAGPPAWFMSNDTVVAAGDPEDVHGSVQLGTPIEDPAYTDYTDLAGVVMASLSFWSEVEPYVNSSTSNNTYRAMGNMGWMVDLAVNIDATNTMQTLGAYQAVKLFVDTTTFWEAQWVSFKKVGPLTVEVQGRNLVTVQYRGIGAGWYDQAAAGTFVEGSLIDPAGTPVWVA